MKQNEWIGLNYTLPREPSRLRVSIWRKLKKIGSISIQQSMWILPWGEEYLNSMNEIKQEVFDSGGEAFVFSFSADPEGEKYITGKFNSARDEEYGELLEQCEDFFKEIDKEIARQNFTFAEIEENEEELNKLKQWHGKIRQRDQFKASLQEKAEQQLVQSEELFEAFCERVYKFNEKR